MTQYRLIGEKFTPKHRRDEINYDKVKKVCRLLVMGLEDEIRPIDVIGNIHRITMELQLADIYEPWMYDVLLRKEDEARMKLE